MTKEKSEPVGEIALAYALEANDTFDAMKAAEREHHSLLLRGAAHAAIMRSELDVGDLAERFEVTTEEAARAMQSPEIFDRTTPSSEPEVERIQSVDVLKPPTPETEAPIDRSRPDLTSSELRNFFTWAGYSERLISLTDRIHNAIISESDTSLKIDKSEDYTRQTEEQLRSSEGVRVIDIAGEKTVDKRSLLYRMHKEWLHNTGLLSGIGDKSIKAIAEYCKHAFTEDEVQDMYQLLQRERQNKTQPLKEQLLDKQVVQGPRYAKTVSLVTDEAIARNLNPDAPYSLNVVTVIAAEIDDEATDLKDYTDDVSVAISNEIVMIPPDRHGDGSTENHLGLTPRRFVQMIEGYVQSPENAPPSVREHLQELQRYASTLYDELLSDGEHSWETPPEVWKREHSSDYRNNNNQQHEQKPPKPEGSKSDGVYTGDASGAVSALTKTLRRIFKK